MDTIQFEWRPTRGKPCAFRCCDDTDGTLWVVWTKPDEGKETVAHYCTKLHAYMGVIDDLVEQLNNATPSSGGKEGIGEQAT